MVAFKCTRIVAEDWDHSACSSRSTGASSAALCTEADAFVAVSGCDPLVTHQANHAPATHDRHTRIWRSVLRQRRGEGSSAAASATSTLLLLLRLHGLQSFYKGGQPPCRSAGLHPASSALGATPYVQLTGRATNVVRHHSYVHASGLYAGVYQLPAHTPPLHNLRHLLSLNSNVIHLCRGATPTLGMAW